MREAGYRLHGSSGESLLVTKTAASCGREWSFWKRLSLDEQIKWGSVSGRCWGRANVVSQVNGE